MGVFSMGNINVNEIIVRAEQVPGSAQFENFEELKGYLESGLSVYKTVDYTEAGIDAAKKDLEELKQIKKKLTDKKKELENAYSMPIEQVTKQLDELIELVKEPFNIVDNIVKEYEKDIKKKKIMEYAIEKASILGEYQMNVVNSKAFFNPKWENKTTSDKSWKADVDEIIQKAVDDITVINEIGQDNKAMLLGFYFDKLSLDGVKEFLNVATSEVNIEGSEEDADDGEKGYKILKVSGTQKQLNQLIKYIEVLGIEVEEIE